MDFYRIEFDGSCWKNPGGTAAFGYALYKNGVEIDTNHGVIGTGPEMSCNVAEFYALAEGLQAFLVHHAEGIANLSIRGDSQLVIKIMNKKWKPSKEKLYYPAYAVALERLKAVRRRHVIVDISWIPRERNTRCDELSKAHNKNMPF